MPKKTDSNPIVPDELKIILKTNVPGFQTISYRPNMTIPNEKSKSVEFNPLIKLNQSVINGIPENIRIREFFDIGLFNSLINSHGMSKVVKLTDATREGFVDNNISVTLNTIFPLKSIIYINKEPYSIADVSWTKRDWNINVKPKDVLDSSLVTDPYMYQALIQEEMERGERQMANLETNVAYGDNYAGPRNPLVTEPAAEEEEETPAEEEEKPAAEEEEEETPAEEEETPAAKEEPIKKPLPLPLPPIPSETEIAPIKPELLPLPPIPPDENCPDLPAPAPSKQSLKVVNTDPVSEPTLYYNKIKVIQIRGLFKKNYYLINCVFKNLDARAKGLIFKNFANSSKVKVKEGAENISTVAYDQSVDGLKIVKNTGGGDCFFIAVADGINYYNYMNQNNKIQIGNYGSGELLITQQVVRQLTYDFIYTRFIKDKTTEEIDTYFEQAIIFVNDLNEAFEKQIRTITSELHPGNSDLDSEGSNMLAPNEYDNIKLAIYTSLPNYLVTYDNGIPKNTNAYYKPFRSVKKGEIKKYILSNSYWGDETAIESIKHTLGLLVVPLETIERNYIVERIKLTRNWFIDEEWDKYMFLLQTPGHFELIQFTYQEKKGGKSQSNIFVPVKLTIFNRFHNLNAYPYSKYIPPIYILFIIFGGLYVSLNDQMKRSFSLLNHVFETILISFNKIKDSVSPDEIQNVDKDKFIADFVKYFPNTRGLFTANQLALVGGLAKPNLQNKHYISHINYNSASNIKPPIPKISAANDAQICYVVTVQLMLKKGTELTANDLSSLSCDRKLNAITKSVSTLMGKTYTIAPNYSNMPSAFSSTKGSNHGTLKSNDPRHRKTMKHNTRKHRNR